MGYGETDTLQLLIIGLPIRIPGGLSFIFTVVFFLDIAGIFLIYLGFWFGYYNMFTAINYTLLVSLETLLVGYKALRARALARCPPVDATKKDN